jgi:hypothetical protein
LPEPARNPKTARTRFVAGLQFQAVASLPFAQARQQLLQGVQIMADRPLAAHVAPAAPFGHRDRNAIFMDIESQIEFFFHSVCLLVLCCLKGNVSGTPVPAVGAALLLQKPE